MTELSLSENPSKQNLTYPIFFDTGYGRDDKSLRAVVFDTVGQLLKPFTSLTKNQHELISGLEEIMHECNQSGWDGYDAVSVSRGAYLDARRFIYLLPNNLPKPEIVPETTGDLCFEWFIESRRILSVCVEGKNEIIFAGLFGADKTYGSATFTDDFPNMVFELVNRLYKKEQCR